MPSRRLKQQQSDPTHAYLECFKCILHCTALLFFLCIFEVHLSCCPRPAACFTSWARISSLPY